ncbi:MAG: succinyl-diaminopimelate desuccinylase [Sphingomonadales bacterium]
MTIDPVQLTAELVRAPSVTPDVGAGLDLLTKILEGLGFQCSRMVFSEAGTPDVDNLYARIGTTRPNFCFAGHMDVVPAGDEAGWTVDPFGGQIIDGVLYGRGASDMKGAIAAFTAAAERFLARKAGTGFGSLSLLITGDEEGPAINGTAKVLDWMADRGEIIDACLVGEPTNPARLGQAIKVGRRGSLNCRLTVPGAQGHVAYPDKADNPLPRLIKMLGRITDAVLDQGTEYFDASNLEVTSIDVGNPAHNVIPARAEAKFNIRFNDLHGRESLVAWLHDRFSAIGGAYELDAHMTGAAFLSPPGHLARTIQAAVTRVLGREPGFSTTGGTSDARYIKDVCPVAEFGLTGQSIHKLDEHVAVADLEKLTDIYAEILNRFFRDQ